MQQNVFLYRNTADLILKILYFIPNKCYTLIGNENREVILCIRTLNRYLY